MKKTIRRWYLRKLVQLDRLIYKIKRFLKRLLLTLFTIELVSFGGYVGAMEMLNKPIVYMAPEAPKIAQVELKGEEWIKSRIEQIALEEGVSPKLALTIAYKESRYNPNAVGDMKITCPTGPHKGKPVYARGLWQITRCYFPEITDEQAFDPEWSTNWAMGHLSKGDKICKMLWTTCR